MSIILLLVAASAQAQEKAIILKKMETALIDAGSARYIWPNPWPAEGVICGKVNSKNTYGGYVGYRRFMARKDAITTTLYIEGPGSAVENGLIDMACPK